MFRITDGRGFHVTFANGWTVSVQFGPYNYCSNRPNVLAGMPWYDRRSGEDLLAAMQRAEREAGAAGSPDAEIAVITPAGGLIQLDHAGWDDTVKGYVMPEELLRVMVWTARRDRWRNLWRRIRAALTREYEFQMPPALLLQGRLLAEKFRRRNKDA